MADVVTRMWISLLTRTQREEGQAITEYALVLALIVGIAVTAAFSGLGTAIENKLSQLSGQIFH